MAQLYVQIQSEPSGTNPAEVVGLEANESFAASVPYCIRQLKRSRIPSLMHAMAQ